ncbi:hypothetical protein BVRB_1g014680 [Beta vulgaris subsp. vulgaris]|uniref:RNA-binding protein 1 n=1 Tax=Beta vulgaris subsp. vulgaris TaxID=3555 RepID=UPI00053F788E|nr:RNA-binding protein 1 [Beta vulgaris subsp. vulgaris]KMT19069.1 hypothetical protein BVRB_1g014680 [Beta vulgaris subsp. vulgaris]
MADSDVGKLFVGGISRDTTDVTLRDHFTKYGDVSSSIIAKDRLSGGPRGFGFVTFSDASSVDQALRDHHVIAGRAVEVKKAIPRNEQQTNTSQQQQQQQQQQPQQRQQSQHLHTSKGSLRNINGSYGGSNNDQYLRAKKIFVGGLSANLTEEEFKNYFEKFGRITDVVVMHDNNTNRPRGFGFITFDSEEVVEKLMQKSHHELGGKRVEVKRAVPRDATKNFNNGNNSRFGGGRFPPAAAYTEDNSWPRGPATVMNYPGHFPLSTYPGYYYGGVYGGGYPVSGYGVFGYGMPMVPPRVPWNGVGMMEAQPFHYGTGFYPTGVNGGVALMGMINGYNGMVDAGGNVKPDQDVSGNTQLPANDSPRQMNGARSDVGNSSSKMGQGVVNGKKNSRSVDVQVQSKVSPVSESS